jgi:hypothetical protein
MIIMIHMAIRTNQVSVLEVEAIELIACLFGVVNVLVDNKCSSLGIIGDTLADLAASKIKLDRVLKRAMEDYYRIGPNLPKRSKSCSAVTL